MDRKSIIILVVSFALFLGLTKLVNHLFPPLPASKNTNLVARAGQTATNRQANIPGIESQSNEIPVLSASTPAGLRASTPTTAWFQTNTPEKTLILENDQLKVTFTSLAGGIKTVELKHHPQAVGSDRRSQPGTINTNSAMLNVAANLPVLAILDGERLQGDGIFGLDRTAQGIRAEKRFSNDLVLVKEFRLSTNYLLEASIRWENQGKQPLDLPSHEWAVGTATPISPRDKNTTLMGVMAYHGGKVEQATEAWFQNLTMGCGLLPSTPRYEYLSSTNVVWSAVYNQFFTLAVIPRDPALRLVAHKIDLPTPSADELAADPKLLAKPFGLQTTLVYPGMRLTAGQAVERRLLIYAGPKEYNTLARLGQEMNNNLDRIMGFGGFFGFFSKLLLLSMNGLNALGMSYGISIIVITIIIKLLFWPLTTASTRSMKRMAALQPQMKAIQAKYKDDPKKVNLKMMEFMKEHRISPMSGCFPVLLQIPVFIGFYSMLQSAIELRGARFLWASDLSTADTIWLIPGLNFPVNPLPLLMGVTMLWQARMTPPSPGMDPMQQKIMKYLPLMFMFMLYNFSAGLTLYWTVQNLLSIAQMKMTKTIDDTNAPLRKPSSPAPKPIGSKKNKA